MFDNHVINPAYADYDKIRSIVEQALSSGGAAGPDDAPGEPTTAASTAPAPPSSTPTAGSSSAGPSSPSPISDVGNACAYDPAQAQKALAEGKPPTKHG